MLGPCTSSQPFDALTRVNKALPTCEHLGRKDEFGRMPLVSGGQNVSAEQKVFVPMHRYAVDERGCDFVRKYLDETLPIFTFLFVVSSLPRRPYPAAYTAGRR